MTTKSALTIYKHLLRELSMSNSHFSYRFSPIYSKIRDEYRRHRPLASKHCKQTDELLFVAQTYLSYLQNIRLRNAVHAKYSKGERSVQQAANIVGLELPKTVDRPHIPFNQLSDAK